MRQPCGNSAWRRATRSIAAAALLTMAAAVDATPATAHPRVEVHPPNVLVHVGNWAGYVVRGEFRHVSATWVQPEITCPNPGVVQRVVPWVGLNGAAGVDGRTALPLMQTGAESLCISEAAMYAALPGIRIEHLAADLSRVDPRLAGQVMRVGDEVSNGLGGVADTLCATGVFPDSCYTFREHTGWWESYPAPPVMYEDDEVAPGDTMHAAVDWDGAVYTMTLENRTRGWTRTAVEASTSPVRTAEIVVEGHLDAALPGFTPITFTEIDIDGRPLSDYDPQVYGIAATNRFLYPGPVDGSSYTIG
ncbi:G1 family glutamic endopeptidase [Nocardia huaxiensis]|uniref:Uncharacterized protein n=1 Tax=Nocardia huaxiensis TaxID=2755382 RepID=A0A7D6V9P3_9NOCA|nr:G1 family glutamic endopeptidase [Nocardia huaxiensis]QLY30114.1 hypothetical protein H0264_33900 [Nocardia huaxiensis]UFS96274.1 hypothetical protein LPY97_37545 [Nocardia huaxiensis]